MHVCVRVCVGVIEGVWVSLDGWGSFIGNVKGIHIVIIVSLTRSLVASASTNTRNTALTIVHIDLLYIFTKVHQHLRQCQ